MARLLSHKRLLHWSLPIDDKSAAPHRALGFTLKRTWQLLMLVMRVVVVVAARLVDCADVEFVGWVAATGAFLADGLRAVAIDISTTSWYRSVDVTS